MPAPTDLRLRALLRAGGLLDAVEDPGAAADAAVAALVPGMADLALLLGPDAASKPAVAAVPDLAPLADALRAAPPATPGPAPAEAAVHPAGARLPPEAGETLAAPFPDGVLVLARRPGGAPFDATDLALAADLARRAGAALERRSLRRRLREAQERLEMVVEATEDVLWEWDVAARRGWRSAGFGEKYAPVPALPDGGEDWLGVVHPDDRPRVGERLARTLAGDAACWSDQYRVLRADGSYAHVADRARILRDASGRAVRLVGAVQDVTRRREAEDAALLQKALLESQNEAALDGIFFQGADGRAVFYNRRLLEMWGVDESVPQGERVEERLAKVVHLLADPQAFVEKVLAMERDRDATLREDLRTADGRIFDCYAAPVRTREGAYAGRVWFYRDVTARRRMEEELAFARRRLAHSEKLAVLGTLVSGVAHEIRTPLAYVSNEAGLLARWVSRLEPGRPLREEEAARLAEAARTIAEGVDRMNHLVLDLRRFSRMEAGERAELDLDETVRAAVDLFQATHRGRARLDAALHSGRRVLADRVHLQQVVLNLLENAAEASPHGASIRVVTRAEGEGQGAVLVVEDRGPGIPTEVQARMWEPFFTTKPEGTGLGLSIVRRIVLAHEGTIRCESGPGQGARFVVRLPSL